MDYGKEFLNCEIPNGRFFTVVLSGTSPQTDMITCNPKVTYGKKTYSLYDTTDLALRDLGKEAAVREVIQRYGEAYDERQKAMVITDQDKISDLPDRRNSGISAAG